VIATLTRVNSPVRPRRRLPLLLVVVSVFALAVGITIAVVKIVGAVTPKPAFPASWYTLTYTVSPHPTKAQLTDAGLFLVAYSAHFGGTAARSATRGDTVTVGVPWDQLGALTDAEGHLRPTVVLRSVVTEVQQSQALKVGLDCARSDAPHRRDTACSFDNAASYQLGSDFLDGTAIRSATAGADGTGWAVTVSFTDAGAAKFAQATREEVGRRLAFVVVPAGDLAPRFAQWAVTTPAVTAEHHGDAKLPGLDQPTAERVAAVLRLAAAGIHLDRR